MKRKFDMKERRNELGLSLQNVADYVGVSKSTVKRWEDEDINMTSDKIDSLAVILKVSPLLFLEEDYDLDSSLIPLFAKKALRIKGLSLDEFIQKEKQKKYHMDADVIKQINSEGVFASDSDIDRYFRTLGFNIKSEDIQSLEKFIRYKKTRKPVDAIDFTKINNELAGKKIDDDLLFEIGVQDPESFLESNLYNNYYKGNIEKFAEDMLLEAEYTYESELIYDEYQQKLFDIINDLELSEQEKFYNELLEFAEFSVKKYKKSDNSDNTSFIKK